MMYLHPPFYMYEGVPVVPDYDDPRQFYYFPNRPHLAVDEQNRPAIRFLVYKENLDEVGPDEEHAVGFLIFDTSLAWPEDTLKRVARKIQADQNLDEPPRLAPLLYKSGTVRLVFLDRATTPPGEKPAEGEQPAEPPSEKWVTFLECSGVPALYGENRAIFSATLTKQATALLYGAFEGFVPAGVVYDLTTVGMQRAFNIKVSADWEQVYHHVAESNSVSAIFFNSDVQKIVDDLVEKKVIKFEASLEGVGEEGMEGEFNEVRKLLQEFVLDKFFKPEPNPHAPDAQDTVDGVVRAARQFRNLGSPIEVGYSRRELDVSEARTLDIDYTITRAVERTIAPQAHLSLFFEDYNLTRDQVVTVIRGDDDFWKEVEFNVAANADFDGDGLFGINVDVAYGANGDGAAPGPEDVSWSFMLDKASPVIKKAAWYDPAAGHSYQYRYNAIFAPAAVPGPQTAVSSGWRHDDGNLIVITPTELYRKRRVEFQLTKNFPFEQYPQVHVQLRYEDPKTGWTHEDAGLLDASSRSALMLFRAFRDAPADVSYRLTYLHGSGEIVTDWRSTADDLVLVKDPRQMFTVRVLVGGDRTKIAQIILDFDYSDPDNQVFESKTLIITQKNIADPQEWSFPLADPQKHRYSYAQTLLDTDGNIITTGWVQSEKNTLPVGILYVKRWEIQPELVGPPLLDNGLELIKLNLRYADAANAYSADKQLVFTQAGRGESWQLDLKDAAAREYTYEVIYVLKTGFERKVGPVAASDTFLIISSVPPEG
jgi:hypothetical protein